MGLGQLRRQYLNLGLGELAAVAAFFGAYWLLRPRLGGDTGTIVIVLSTLAFVLVQGSAYSLLARTWIPGRMPVPLAGVYRVLRWLNPVALAALAVLIVLRPGSSPWLSSGLWLFALIEYVNYFWIRLSYPLSHWLARVAARRPSVLARDLARVAR